jgi:SpoIIAA-like
MLTLIEGMPANVVAIEASGTVEADDYRDVLDPAAAAAIKAHGKVRLLYLLGDAFSGYSPGAMWEDTKLAFHDLSAWERIAVVTDHGALADAIRVFGWLIPAEVRTYETGQLDDAKAWVSEG